MLGLLFSLLISIVLTVLSYVLRPKPQRPEADRDIQVPEARQGKPIPVVFGTRFVNDPSVVWWGDVWIIQEGEVINIP